MTIMWHMAPAPGLIGALILSLVPFVPAWAEDPGVGTRYLHADHLGSVAGASDGAGRMVARKSYRPNGAPRTVPHPGERVDGTRFTGKPWEPAPALYFFGARWHDPVLGRFLGPDTARQSSSPYIYAGVAPLERLDRDGNWYTELFEILDDVATQHDIALGSAENRLLAGYLARMCAIEARRYFNRLAGSLKRQRVNLKREVEIQKRIVNKEVVDAEIPYRNLANVARSVKMTMDSRGPSRSFVPSARLEKVVTRYQKAGHVLPAAWKRLRNKMAEIEHEPIMGSKWGAYRTILASAVEEFESKKLTSSQIESKAVRLLDGLRNERTVLRTRAREALANARRIDEIVMQELDDYINTQRRSLGLPPDKPWSTVRAGLQ